MNTFDITMAINPISDLESQPYWEGLKHNELRLQKCLECAKNFFPPRPSCPYCGSNRLQWETMVEQGKLFSWTVVHAPALPALRGEAPYILGLVELQAGPRIVGRVVGCSPDELGKDMPVRFHYHHANDEYSLLVFEPERGV